MIYHYEANIEFIHFKCFQIGLHFEEESGICSESKHNDDFTKQMIGL